MKETTVKDMTSGAPWKLILLYAIPIFLSNLFQQVYTVADTAIVSKTLGDQALAAVGSIGSVNYLIIGFCNGIGTGFSIPIAQRFGARDNESVRRYTGNAIWIYVVISIVVTVPSALMCRTILEVTKTPTEIMEMAYQYLFVILLGIPAQFAYNALSGIIRALGDSKTPLYILIAASLVNIVLDLVFILVIPLGTMGAALATVISQVVSVIGCIVLIVKKIPELHITKEDLRPRRKQLQVLLRYGMPMGIQMSVTGIGNILLQTSVNSLGTLAVAAAVAGDRICNMVIVANCALASAMSVYCGQNLGAEKYQRIRSGIKHGLILGQLFTVAAFLMLWMFGRELTFLFLDSDSVQVIELTLEYIRIVALFLWAQSLIFIIRFAIQGLGYAYIALAACLLEMVARALIGLYFVPTIGFAAAAFSSPAAWLFADILLIPAGVLVMKKMTKLERSCVAGYAVGK